MNTNPKDCVNILCEQNYFNLLHVADRSSLVAVCPFICSEVYICIGALRPRQHFFSYVGMISCLPCLNEYYYKAADNVSRAMIEHSDSSDSLPTEPLRYA